MNNLNDGIKPDMDAFAKAQQLRKEADALEKKEKMKIRILKLTEISEDPYYDQYLNQMLKDLESGKATPEQVGREADRTYRLYQQRMQLAAAQKAQQEGRQETRQEGRQETPAPGPDVNQITVQKELKVRDNGDETRGSAPGASVQTGSGKNMEFKVGAGIFSTVGAVFVLVAFVIFGFNFLNGVWQGICLYAAALAVLLISELILKRLNKTFSLVITGIGISALFISTVINYLVLKTINGAAAAIITFVIAFLSILLSRKKDAASIRMISILGCYISFLPIRGFESELSFLIMAGMLFIINLVSVFLPNQKNRTAISTVHIIAHTVFTGLMTGRILADGMGAMYPACFVIASLLLLNIIYLRQKQNNKLGFTIAFSIAIGFCVVFLISIFNFGYEMESEKLVLFYKLLTEVMAIVSAIVFFILWEKNKYRWIQYYFAAAIVVLFNGFSDYKLEVTIGILVIYILTKLLSGVRELTVLDCVLSVITAICGLFMTGQWYVWPFGVIIMLSVIRIRRMAVFHEIVITLFFILGILLQFDSNWTLPGCMGMLLACFLVFNHLPKLKSQKQLPYNIVNVVFAGCFQLCTLFCEEYVINSVAMLIGALSIIIMFSAKYGMAIRKKYLVLAGYLVFMILTANFQTPIIVSILLMVVAIGCVGLGFRVKDKIYRICGLVMAICVCVKLIVYDFRELEALSKAVLFLVVGIIALGISFLYIYLERKEDREEVKREEKAKTEAPNAGNEEAEAPDAENEEREVPDGGNEEAEAPDGGNEEAEVSDVENEKTGEAVEKKTEISGENIEGGITEE